MTADTIGGVWTYAVDLARACSDSGVETVLATMGAPMSEHQKAEVRKVRKMTVHESRYRLEWMEDPWEDVERAGEWLLALEAKYRPDLVHLNGYAHGDLPWKAPAMVVGHSCVLSWWKAVKKEPAPSTWDRYRERVARGLSAASRVAAPSGMMMDALVEHYRVRGPGTVIHNGRCASLYRPGRKTPIVLSAGRVWDEAKNLAALRYVAGRVPATVCVAGDERNPEGREAAKVEGVRMLGRLPPQELAKWYARAMIYALPARYEPFGLSALEAGLSGCALVLGDLPSFREVWGEAAVYVPPEDGDALAEAINRLLSDNILRTVYAARAYVRAQMFTPKRMAERYLSAYREMTGREDADRDQ